MTNALVKRFPFILVERHNDMFEGTACIIMKSILAAELMLGVGPDAENPYLDRINPYVLYQARKEFLYAISGWTSDVVLEMRISSFPNLLYKPQSHVNLCLVIRYSDKSEEDVKEKIFSTYLAIAPLLQTYMSEADFAPVTDEDELRQYLTPAEFKHATSVQRKRENVELTNPYPGFNRIGFGHRLFKPENTPLSVLHYFPWLPVNNDWSYLISTMLGQLDPVQIIVRIKPVDIWRDAASRLVDDIKKCETFLKGTDSDHEDVLKIRAHVIRNICVEQLARLEGAAFRAGVFLLGMAPFNSSLGHVLGNAITKAVFDDKEKNFLKGGFELESLEVGSVLKMDTFSESEPVTAEEAACCFRLPSPPTGMGMGLPVKRYRTVLGSLPVVNPKQEVEVMSLFDNIHQGVTQPVKIGLEDRFRHMYMLGQTGTGKSKLMESMVLQDIYAGYGVGVVDPHGELVEDIIGKIPESRIEDVILLDLLDIEHPIGFNLLEWNTLYERDLIIDELYNSLDRVYDFRQTGGPIFEHNFRQMLTLLMGDKPRKGFVATILDFILCYQSSDFREFLRDTISDLHTKDFLKELEDATSDCNIRSLSPYITSKFSRFTSDTTLKHIVGQSHTPFDFNDVLNNNKIFLIKLGKGRYGSTVSALLANQIVSRFKFAAMKRGSMRPEQRKPFFLYVDEAHNLPRENFTELLAEARKYKLGLVLATQYMSQMQGESYKDNLLQAIMGNVGTIMAFRLGQEDAKLLAPSFSPSFSSLDIVNLPNFHGYAKMQLNNEATPPFSFCTSLCPIEYSDSTASKVIKYSRDKYSKSVEDVEHDILERRNIWLYYDD